MQFNEEPETGGKSNFVSLKDGEAIKGVPRGEVKVFYNRWNGTKSEPCEKGADGARFRFKFNLVVNDNGEWKAKVFEQGPSLYNAMKELAEDYNLEETVVKIKREGTGLDTRYHVMPMPTKLTKEHLEQIKKVELNPLEKKDIPNLAPNFDSDEEIPF